MKCSCFQEVKCSVSSDSCAFCLASKLMRATLTHCFGLIPGQSWINSHFCPFATMHLFEKNMKRISEEYNSFSIQLDSKELLLGLSAVYEFSYLPPVISTSPQPLVGVVLPVLLWEYAVHREVGKPPDSWKNMKKPQREQTNSECCRKSLGFVEKVGLLIKAKFNHPTNRRDQTLVGWKLHIFL